MRHPREGGGGAQAVLAAGLVALALVGALLALGTLAWRRASVASLRSAPAVPARPLRTVEAPPAVVALEEGADGAAVEGPGGTRSAVGGGAAPAVGAILWDLAATFSGGAGGSEGPGEVAAGLRRPASDGSGAPFDLEGVTAHTTLRPDAAGRARARALWLHRHRGETLELAFVAGAARDRWALATVAVPEEPGGVLDLGVVELSPVPLVVAGRVVDDLGRPLRARVRVSGFEGVAGGELPWARTRTCGADGGFRLTGFLPPGSLRVEPRLVGHVFAVPPPRVAVGAVLGDLVGRRVASLGLCADPRDRALLDALEGRFVPAGGPAEARASRAWAGDPPTLALTELAPEPGVVALVLRSTGAVLWQHATELTPGGDARLDLPRLDALLQVHTVVLDEASLAGAWYLVNLRVVDVDGEAWRVAGPWPARVVSPRPLARLEATFQEGVPPDAVLVDGELRWLDPDEVREAPRRVVGFEVTGVETTISF